MKTIAAFTWAAGQQLTIAVNGVESRSDAVSLIEKIEAALAPTSAPTVVLEKGNSLDPSSTFTVTTIDLPEPEDEPIAAPAQWSGTGSDSLPEPPVTVEGRPGMNPAAALAAYGTQYGDGEPEPTTEYEVGGRYDGVKIVRVQTSKSQGFGVLTLQDGTRVKYDLKTGHEIGRKNSPPIPADAHVEVETTSRQSGRMAPQEDKPLADTSGTPDGQIPGWLAEVIKAKTLKTAVKRALDRIERDDFMDWALSNRTLVPAFARINEDKFRGRIERQLVAQG
jgi:hypothetical protein